MLDASDSRAGRGVRGRLRARPPAPTCRGALHRQRAGAGRRGAAAGKDRRDEQPDALGALPRGRRGGLAAGDRRRRGGTDRGKAARCAGGHPRDHGRRFRRRPLSRAGRARAARGKADLPYRRHPSGKAGPLRNRFRRAAGLRAPGKPGRGDARIRAVRAPRDPAALWRSPSRRGRRRGPACADPSPA